MGPTNSTAFSKYEASSQKSYNLMNLAVTLAEPHIHRPPQQNSLYATPGVLPRVEGAHGYGRLEPNVTIPPHTLFDHHRTRHFDGRDLLMISRGNLLCLHASLFGIGSAYSAWLKQTKSMTGSYVSTVGSKFKPEPTWQPFHIYFV